ncbi:UDP-D-xylose:L-fucose alpha-1,3-D-xylosyltransferase M [Sesamum angolense]|uniref:UDP-D-xylose:L-fucose alpha-1,3-D-xylosyltransferase M n=1 Tax=Sesamum angolense TaxID=2727404 RepID=A0AAE1T7L4_9LAMI|nr:UDP-D-xylose:L-fucose alpha-1,3-D-xylosyltransferase M [Sesamum angolense]
MSSFLHQRSLQPPSSDPFELSPRSRQNYQKPTAALLSRGPALLLLLLSLLVILGVIFPYLQSPISLFSFKSWSSDSKWREYTLPDAAAYVAKNNTLIVCAVSEAYLPFLNNWLISIARQKQQDKVLVIAEDFDTLYKVNERWPGHAVLVPPALEAAAAHKFGSQVKPLNHSHGLPPPGKKGRPYICSCMIYLRPTPGAKLVMKKWIEELQAEPWSKAKKANDQPGFNWALLKTAAQATSLDLDRFVHWVKVELPPAMYSQRHLCCWNCGHVPATSNRIPNCGLYFRNKTWVKETKGMHVIIHNNYIVGFEKKIKRFRDYGLWAQLSDYLGGIHQISVKCGLEFDHLCPWTTWNFIRSILLENFSSGVVALDAFLLLLESLCFPLNLCYWVDLHIRSSYLTFSFQEVNFVRPLCNGGPECTVKTSYRGQF